MPIRHLIPFVCGAVVLLLPALVAGEPDEEQQSCARFEYPRPGTTISHQLCTLSIEACEEARSVLFKAEYASLDRKTTQKITLGNITRPPFKLIWNITNVSNQLLHDLVLPAEITLKDGTREQLRLEGVFLTHQPVAPPRSAVKYERRMNSSDISFAINASDMQARADVHVHWNEEELVCRVRVYDPLFHTAIPEEKKSLIGVEILLDPALSRRPYPSLNDYSLFIPLHGPALAVSFAPEFSPDGDFELVRSANPSEFGAELRTSDFEGYRIATAIPMEELAPVRPDSLACNVVIRAFDEDERLRHLAWAPAHGNDIYSPILWGTLTLKPKPLTKSFAFLWILYFGVGLLGTQIVWASRGFWRKRDSLVRFEYAEKNRDLLRRIERALQEHVTEKDLDSNKIAALVPASPRRIEKVLKKGRGETFQTLLMRSRVEIAKERLRSSRSSEAFVANSCGFKSVDEMEKCFARFCRTTPFKYRREFHVT